MNKFFTTVPAYFFVYLFIFPVLTNAEDGGLSPKLEKIDIECVYSNSQIYSVPMSVLLGIIRFEDGHIGEAVRNLDGSIGYGPAHINSDWIAKLEQYGMSATRLQNDGCANIMSLAWLIHINSINTKSLWRSVGIFHSQKRDEQVEYVGNVFDSLPYFEDVDSIIERANNK